MRQEPAEEAGAFACAIRQDAHHQASVVVVEHRPRHPAEESESMNVAVDPSLGGCRWIGPNVTRIAIRRYPGGTEKLSIFFTLSRETPK